MKNIARLLLLSCAATAVWAGCPAGTSASQIIQSSKWAFNLKSGDLLPPGAAAVGTFQSVGNGQLQVVITYTDNGVVTRQQQATGRYILYPDCTGGELLFHVNGLGFQLEFVFTNSFTELYVVTDDWQPRYSVTSAITGVARTTTTGCPAGLGDPLNILNNTNWAFRTYAPYFATIGNLIGPGPGSASIGIFSPTLVGGSPRLTGTETINYGPNGPIVSHAELTGRYMIYPDCSGGEILLMDRGNPVPSLHLEFVFAGPNFGEMYMLNDSISTSQSIVAGYASKL